MKKFFIVLLCVILCVVVSCKTPKVTTGSNDAGETQSLEHVDSADAFDGADLTQAPVDEGSTSEVIDSEVSESGESEGEVSEVGEKVGFDDSQEDEVVENLESSSIESVDEVESPSETPDEDAFEQETESVEVETIESSDVAEVSEQTESTESFEEPIVEMENVPAVEVQNSEAATQVPSSTPVVSSTMSSHTNLAEEVPNGFVDEVIYFVKNNILISIGLLSIAIGVIWLLVDLIKFIVKSIKSNCSHDDEDFENVEEVKEIREKNIENSNSNEDNEKHEFQDEDEFLRSLLNTEEDL